MRRGLVHSGGNAKGGVAPYVLRKLMETWGLEAYVKGAGVSVGAVNVPMFFEDKLDQLEALYRRVKSTRFYMAPNLDHLQQGVFELKPLARKLRRESALEDLAPHAEVYVGVYDYQSDCYRSISCRDMPDAREWRRAQLASCAQPVIMQGYDVLVHVGPERKPKHHLCFDGGLRNVIPQLPGWQDLDAIDVILCSPVKRRNYKPREDVDKILEIAGRTLDVVLDGILLEDLDRLKDWAAADVEVTLYAPEDAGSAFDASAETMRWRLDEVGPAMWANPVQVH